MSVPVILRYEMSTCGTKLKNKIKWQQQNHCHHQRQARSLLQDYHEWMTIPHSIIITLSGKSHKQFSFYYGCNAINLTANLIGRQ